LTGRNAVVNIADALQMLLIINGQYIASLEALPSIEKVYNEVAAF
jgi:hypothetical protein